MNNSFFSMFAKELFLPSFFSTDVCTTQCIYRECKSNFEKSSIQESISLMLLFQEAKTNVSCKNFCKRTAPKVRFSLLKCTIFSVLSPPHFGFPSQRIYRCCLWYQKRITYIRVYHFTTFFKKKIVKELVELVHIYVPKST